MGSKIFLLLGLSIAFALLISSEVAARDLAETTTKPEDYIGGGDDNDGNNIGGGSNNGGANNNVGGSNNGGGYRNRGGCYRYCRGIRCCSAAEEAALKAIDVKPQN